MPGKCLRKRREGLSLQSARKGSAAFQAASTRKDPRAAWAHWCRSAAHDGCGGGSTIGDGGGWGRYRFEPWHSRHI